MKALSGTARRLLVSFAALLAVFGVASAFALGGLGEVHASLQRVKAQEASVRAALDLARAVRDQYAHQAHTIILGNMSHLGFYAESLDRVAEVAGTLRARVDSDEQRVLVGEIERASREIDEVFRARIVPAVERGDLDRARMEHDGLLGLVSRVEARVDSLADRAEERIGVFEAHAAQVQRSTYRWTVVMLVGAMLLALAIGIYIWRSVARPVAVLEAGAARVGSGDLSTRLEIRTNDEFGRLAQQFNAMTVALVEHQDKLVQSERLASIGRLAAGVAHEINNPLGVILGYARLLSRRADEETREDLQIIEDEARRCQAIVEGLLDLARPMRQEHDAVDLRELCDDVLERLQDSGVTGDVEVHVDGRAQVAGSTGKLRQVVLNLLKNAIESASPEGRVEVMLAMDERGSSLSVRDSGDGLSDDVKARIFEPFFTTRASGTGLGLSVSQAIANAHGGTLDAENHPDGGAVFTLRLPSQTAEESR